MSEALLVVNKLEKAYGKKQILKEVSFSIAKGETVALLGPSGSGKSTILRCLNGLEEFQGGELVFNGSPIVPTEKNWQQLRPKIGMVFQSYDLFPNKTVFENVTLAPINVQKRSKDEVENLANALLTRVGLAELATSYPHQLSGGQKQRVAIVRCLCMQPELLLLDEVTAALDPEMVREVLEVILELAKQDSTMLIVTHEMAFAKLVSDRVIFMTDGEIVEITPTKEFFATPQTTRAQDFLQSLDFNHL